MKKIVRSVLIAAALVAVSLPASVSAGPPEKVPLCHFSSADGGTYSYKEVPNNKAYDAHLAHGDKLDGDAVPEMEGYSFDAACNIVADPTGADSDGDGVEDSDDNCVDDPNPDQSDRYGSGLGDACETDSDGDGVLDVDEAHLCVSIDGALIRTTGSVTCITDQSTTGLPNIAVADGENAYALAGVGSNNTAVASGEFADARAFSGASNSALATGLRARAEASNGDSNLAAATGTDSLAAAGSGSGNTAVADGDNSDASATAGSNNSATASAGTTSCAGAGDSGEMAGPGDNLC